MKAYVLYISLLRREMFDGAYYNCSSQCHFLLTSYKKNSEMDHISM